MLNFYKIKRGVEIHYDGDLPARSGMGSSSCFTVGLMRALNVLNGEKKISNNKLASNAIYFEQKIMKEIVGSQDQIAASIGGFNKIIFKKKDKFLIKKIKKEKKIKKIEKNLILIYTGINRSAHKIASTYVSKLSGVKRNYIKNIYEQVSEGEKLLNSGRIDDFGKLLNDAWYHKKKLSSSVSNNKIDELYDFAIKHGALGGKLLGAGGGGFLLMYMEEKYRKNFFQKNPKLINIPFNFINEGSSVIFQDLKDKMKLNHKLMHNNFTNQDISAVKNFLKNKDIILTQSKKVDEFEKKWSKWLGVKYSTFVNSGSSANFITISIPKAINKDKKNEIIVPTLTWVSDINSVIMNGFKPVFVDVDLLLFNVKRRGYKKNK